MRAAALALALLLAAPPARAAPDDPVPYFFVGGRYVGDGDAQVMAGQMYVRHLAPTSPAPPGSPAAIPIVMVHGTAQTGTNFLGTPDGRRGWAQWFAAHGRDVYVVDQVGRGRSGQSERSYGPAMRLSTRDVSSLFTGQETYALFPQARLHTQWPGGPGVPGNPAFDQFFASEVESIASALRSEELNDPALVALLQRIGPAILLTHSQSGAFGWKVADSHPELVRALVAVEPNGPPFRDPVFKGGDLGGAGWYGYPDAVARPYGITRVPLDFDPPAASPADLAPTLQPAPADPALMRCILPGGTPRRLPRLATVPIAVVTAEASFRASSDHCTTDFLAQAGVPVEHIVLAGRGVHGNGHMMMLESNSDAIAAVIQDWLGHAVAVRQDSGAR